MIGEVVQAHFVLERTPLGVGSGVSYVTVPGGATVLDILQMPDEFFILIQRPQWVQEYRQIRIFMQNSCYYFEPPPGEKLRYLKSLFFRGDYYFIFLIEEPEA